VNEKSRAKTNSTHNVKVMCDKNVRMTMEKDYKQEEEIKKGMLEGTKTPYNH